MLNRRYCQTSAHGCRIPMTCQDRWRSQKEKFWCGCIVLVWRNWGGITVCRFLWFSLWTNAPAPPPFYFGWFISVNWQISSSRLNLYAYNYKYKQLSKHQSVWCRCHNFFNWQCAARSPRHLHNKCKSLISFTSPVNNSRYQSTYSTHVLEMSSVWLTWLITFQ